MDIATHVLVPFAAAALVGLPRRERLAAAVGGAAPDLDVLTLPIAHWIPELYFLGHRGASHSLITGPIWALGLLGILALPRVRVSWPRRVARATGIDEATVTRRSVLLCAAGAVVHVLLDGLTITGAPMLWPVWHEWRTLNVFFYSSVPVLVASAYLLARRVRGRLPDASLPKAMAAWIALLVVAGALQVATRPAAEGVEAFPAQPPGVWHAFRTHPNGSVEAWTAGWYGEAKPRWYEPLPPADAPATAALAIGEATPEHRAFRWNVHGPAVVRVEARPEGGHHVTFLDVVARYEIDTSGFHPLREVAHGVGKLEVVVDAEGGARIVG